MDPAKNRTVPRWSYTLLVLVVLLVVDWLFVHTIRYRHGRGAFDPPLYPITRVNGQLQLATDVATESVGGVMLINRRHGGHGLWAPLEETLEVRVEIFLNDGSTTTTADQVRLGNQLADYRGETGMVATFLRQGGGTFTEPRPWGYVHNTGAALIALGIVACAASMARAQFAATRASNRFSQGRCRWCGYPVHSATCPECGRSP